MKKRPNILLVFPDQLRGDWVEPIANVPVRTPNSRRLAAQGACFRNVWTPSPICAPARACLATGNDYDRSPVRHNNESMPANCPTLYTRLSEVGYNVVTTGKLDLLKGSMDWGADGTHPRASGSGLSDLGFTGGLDNAGKHDALFGRDAGADEPYMGYLASLGLDEIHYNDFQRRQPGGMTVSVREAQQHGSVPPPSYANTDVSPLPPTAYCDNWIGNRAVHELTNLLEQDAPWMLTVNFAGPHEPLDVTERMRERWHDVAFPAPSNAAWSDVALSEIIRQNYAAMIELIDDYVGHFLDLLELSGSTEDTLVVLASDHGEMLGDCDIWGKSVPHTPSLHVPLIMAGAGVKPVPSQSLKSPISLLDLTATLLDIAGARPLGEDGMSLWPTLQTGTPHCREFAFSGLGNWRAVSDGTRKLVAGYQNDIVPTSGQFMTFDPASIENASLYDLNDDPWDCRDIGKAQPEAFERLQHALSAHCTNPSAQTACE